MIKDKYSAVWVSYSSISDYLKCPRSYYLKNVYRDPKSNRKMSLMQPALALGQIVHDTVESLSLLQIKNRKEFSLMDSFHTNWEKVSGKKGGFIDAEEENGYKLRGEAMIQRIIDHPGPIYNKAIKIRKSLPYFWLSEEENIILCGKIDWIEYLEETDSIHIIDFKTGKHEEDADSLQLPIYYLLAIECQSRPVSKMSYWYLGRETEPFGVDLPDGEKARRDVFEVAKRIALARKLERFVCPKKDGCMFCRHYESILEGNAEHVGTNAYRQDIFVLKK
ncbi:RecB family exonuclease [Patescibacteria group bacterium]